MKKARMLLVTGTMLTAGFAATPASFSAETARTATAGKSAPVKPDEVCSNCWGDGDTGGVGAGSGGDGSNGGGGGGWGVGGGSCYNYVGPNASCQVMPFGAFYKSCLGQSCH